MGRVARAGRSGVAYNLVSPDEVSFMLDLHLFLGRGLNMCSAAPPQDLAAAAESQDGLFGAVPQTVIDHISDQLQATHDQADLDSMYKVVRNAYKLYDK